MVLKTPVWLNVLHLVIVAAVVTMVIEKVPQLKTPMKM
jgi:hypothetical protein